MFVILVGALDVLFQKWNANETNGSVLPEPRDYACKANPVNMSCCCCCTCLNRVNLSFCKVSVHSRFPHAVKLWPGRDALACPSPQLTSQSIYFSYQHLLGLLHCHNDTDSMCKTNTWKVTRVVCTRGFSQCVLGWYLYRVWGDIKIIISITGKITSISLKGVELLCAADSLQSANIVLTWGKR